MSPWVLLVFGLLLLGASPFVGDWKRPPAGPTSRPFRPVFDDLGMIEPKLARLAHGIPLPVHFWVFGMLSLTGGLVMLLMRV